jgi:hypothetical protein
MSFNDFVMRDFYRMDVGAEASSLSKRDKFKLIDFFLQKPTDPSKRGLKVTIDISHGARRINNRFYPPSGQLSGIDSWSKPYPKPLIMNHDTNSDPLGRISDVRQLAIPEAVNHFKRVEDYITVKNAFDAGDPKTIYKTLKRFGLLVDTTWPGLTKLEADVLVTDEKAIERFLDKRYLTVSAGTTSDRYACGICGQDWMADGPCEHMPGMTTEDGEIGTIFTGAFTARELSIVNEPADNVAMVSNMVFTDSVKSAEFNDVFNTSSGNFLLTDAVITLPNEVDMNLDEIKASILDELKEMVNVQLAEFRTLLEGLTPAPAPAAADGTPTEPTAVPEVVPDPITATADISTLVQKVADELLTAIKAGLVPTVAETVVDATELEALKTDLGAALALVESSKQQLADRNSQLDNVLRKVALQRKHTFVDLTDGNELDSMYAWFDKIGETNTSGFIATDHVVENPTGQSLAGTSGGKQLTTFEKTVCERYNDIKKAAGVGSAELFLNSNRKYLPRDFHPDKIS